MARAVICRVIHSIEYRVNGLTNEAKMRYNHSINRRYSTLSGVIMRFIDELRARYHNDLVNDAQINQLFNDRSPTAIRSAVSRSLRAGDLIRLKRGVYLFGARLQKRAIVKFALASQLYSPSYISFESALSYYQLIPEAVYSTTSACYFNKSKSFVNDLGEFSYEYVPVRPFFLDVQTLKMGESNVLIASPLRALYDKVYKRKIAYKDLLGLDEDLRVDLDELSSLLVSYSKEDLILLSSLYKSTSVKKLNQLLIEAFK